MSNGELTAKRAWRMPDTYIIIFLVVIFAAILTWLVPVGVFTGTQEAANGKTVLDPASYTNLFVETDGELVADAAGSTHTKPIALFKPFGGMGLLNYVFEGLTSGSKWGTAVGIIAFILIAGGSFGIVLRTGAVEAGIMSMIRKTPVPDSSMSANCLPGASVVSRQWRSPTRAVAIMAVTGLRTSCMTI